jgi:hypothetical protein
MQKLHGPTYRHSGEQCQDTVIYIADHHYDADEQCYHVDRLLNGNESTIIFDHVVQHDDILKKYNLLYFPSFIAKENQQFVEQQIIPEWTNKTRTFNFMINKPRPHRILLLELIKKYNLTNYTHSLPWQVNTINNIPVTNYAFGPEITMERGIRNGHYKNAHTYQGLLQKTIFEPACISLITEPAYYEKETILTEKTLMAMYAGTFPIWVGGWRLADHMKSLGFDVFDDVIDHSYQDMPDPFDRCYYAIERNVELLKNFDQASRFIAENQDRLRHNIKLIEDNVFLTDCVAKINQYTGSTRNALCTLVSLIQPNLVANYRNQAGYQLLGTIT